MIFFKKLAFKVFYSLFEFKQQYKLKAVKNKQHLYIIDIDNTLTISTLNEKINHKNPNSRTKVIQYLLNKKEESSHFIFLSARDFRLFDITFQWLKNHGLIEEKNQLFLVESAKAKIPYLETFIKNNHAIIYVDDLSYNHENGEVKFYDTIIKKVNQMPLTYHGVDFIENL